MSLTAEQQLAIRTGACVALGFLVYPERRDAPRSQMRGISDEGIFHRWMGLFWAFRDPEGLSVLTPKELELVEQFQQAFDALPWRPIDAYPFISEVEPEVLAKLTPLASRLLRDLERHPSRQLSLFSPISFAIAFAMAAICIVPAFLWFALVFGTLLFRGVKVPPVQLADCGVPAVAALAATGLAAWFSTWVDGHLGRKEWTWRKVTSHLGVAFLMLIPLTTSFVYGWGKAVLALPSPQ